MLTIFNNWRYIEELAMSQLKEAAYQCTSCNELRTLSFDMQKHSENTSKSANGLALYSDIHRCIGGFLGINNLRVDHNTQPMIMNP